MNAFPDDYLVHNLPLIILSGLGEEDNYHNAEDKTRTLLSEGGFRVKTDIPPVTTSTAQLLLKTLLKHDASNNPWHGRVTGKTENNSVFRIRCAGRAYTLPPRKAPPLAHSPRLRPTTDSSTPPPQLVLHSMLSPLTPSSPLYPDGIMTPLWITKHQLRLPSAFISFFTLASDRNTSTLQDNKLKQEINSVRSLLTSTNYKTRFAVVLLADGLIDVAEAEERLANIKRATSLDAKSLFFLAAGHGLGEISEFSKNMLSGMYPSCVEYYRDLSKHARRKRNRNVAPQPTVQPTSGTSHILSLPAWNVRYEFKLGVFAEFRQEMEAALKNYETAYEGLFGAEVFETIPSWSPRFNEARLLADVIATRTIRCLLWLDQTTIAVRSWLNHRNRIQSLIDRRGTGTNTYGWEAWQSTWSRTMSDLVSRAQTFAPLESSGSAVSILPLFVSAEKSIPSGQRHTPWEQLHHEGYWLNLAQRYTQNRRSRALQMPEEDRNPPGQSPASAIASKAHLYDKYLTLEPHEEFPVGDDKPGYDYTNSIIQDLDVAVDHFSKRGQIRMADVLQLKKATELMQGHEWEKALMILQKIWQSRSWRSTGWWDLLEQVGKSLLACVEQVDKTNLTAELHWQLSQPVFRQSIDQLKSLQLDTDPTKMTGKVQAALDTEHALTQFVPNFTFASAEGHVGELMDAQLSLRSLASAIRPSFQLSQVKIVFEGGLKPIYLFHDSDSKTENNDEDVVVAEAELGDLRSRSSPKRRSSVGAMSAVTADTDLTLQSGQTKVFQMKVLPREAGDVSVTAITMSFLNNNCEMTITSSDFENQIGQWWELRRGRPVSRLCGSQRDAAVAKVLPKPPKVNIQIRNLQKVFYTNESIDLEVHLENHEEEDISGNMAVRLLSPGKNNAILRSEGLQSSAQVQEPDAVAFIQSLPTQELQGFNVNASRTQVISIANTDEALDHELEVVINYSLSSSPDTKLSKILTVDIPIVRPFEANFSFHSRHHPEAWPNFFSSQTAGNSTEEPGGIKQKYLITAVICSFALEELSIESAYLLPQKIIGGAACDIKPGVLRQAGEASEDNTDSTTVIRPEETKKYGFDMTLQKVVLGHRQPVAVDVSLEVQWKRKGSDSISTSILQVPRFLAASAEPRVLLQLDKEQALLGLYRLKYTIENPSLHFLTFNLNMESSDDFAFSGPKSKSISLVPVSRHDVSFKILVNKNKAWVRVHLEVVDAYFGPTLKIQPASDGVRVDKQGNVLIWVEH